MKRISPLLLCVCLCACQQDTQYTATSTPATVETAPSPGNVEPNDIDRISNKISRLEYRLDAMRYDNNKITFKLIGDVPEDTLTAFDKMQPATRSYKRRVDAEPDEQTRRTELVPKEVNRRISQTFERFRNIPRTGESLSITATQFGECKTIQTLEDFLALSGLSRQISGVQVVRSIDPNGPQFHKVIGHDWSDVSLCRYPELNLKVKDVSHKLTLENSVERVVSLELQGWQWSIDDQAWDDVWTNAQTAATGYQTRRQTDYQNRLAHVEAARIRCIENQRATSILQCTNIPQFTQAYCESRYAGPVEQLEEGYEFQHCDATAAQQRRTTCVADARQYVLYVCHQLNEQWCDSPEGYHDFESSMRQESRHCPQ